MPVQSLQPSDLGDLPHGEIAEEWDGRGRLERRGNAVDWRGPDDRLLVLGRPNDPDVRSRRPP